MLRHSNLPLRLFFTPSLGDCNCLGFNTIKSSILGRLHFQFMNLSYLLSAYWATIGYLNKTKNTLDHSRIQLKQ